MHNKLSTLLLFNVLNRRISLFQILAFEKDLLKQLSEVDEREVTSYVANSIAQTIADFQRTLAHVRSLIEEHITDEMVAEHGGIDDLEDNIPGWILAIVCGVEPRVSMKILQSNIVIHHGYVGLI